MYNTINEVLEVNTLEVTFEHAGLLYIFKSNKKNLTNQLAEQVKLFLVEKVDQRFEQVTIEQLKFRFNKCESIEFDTAFGMYDISYSNGHTSKKVNKVKIINIETGIVCENTSEIDASKVKINITENKINQNKIKIATPDTTICNLTRIEFPNIKELEKEVKQLRKELKENKVKLNKSDTLKLLKERISYEEMVNEYHETFNKLVEAWQYKLKEGIYVGYVNDTYINEVIKPLSNKVNEMNINSSLITNKIISIANKVEEVKSELKYGTEYYSIAI